MKKVIAIMLAAVMIVSLAACGSSGGGAATTKATEAASSGAVETPAGGDDNATEAVTEAETEDPYADIEKEVIIGVTSDPENFYPWGHFSQGGKHILPTLYQTLLSDVRNPETGTITYYHTLMESYEKVDDTHYEVKIREGIVDTAGNPFTANDVAFCWNKFQEGSTSSVLAHMTAYEVQDDYTLLCTVSDGIGIGDFEEILSTVNMVTQASFEASPDEMYSTPVGTTGYVLDEYVPGSYCSVKRAPNGYWNEEANISQDIDAGYFPASDNTKVDRVRFEFITDLNTMAIALESGQIDIAGQLAIDDIAFYSSDPAYSVFQFPDNMYGLVFDCSASSPLNNENLRKAIAYSVSADDLLKMIYGGDGYKLHALAMSHQLGYVSSWDDEPYFEKDMDKAKEFFDAWQKETGKTGADISMEIAVNSTNQMNKYAQVVQASIIELTGNANACSIRSYDDVTYAAVKEDPNQFDMFIENSLTNKTYILYNWNKYFNGATRGTGDDICFTGDTKLWELEVAAQKTLSEEDCDAFQQYLNEHAYYINYICGPAYFVGSSLVAGWVYGAKNSIAVCGMTFDWSQKY